MNFHTVLVAVLTALVLVSVSCDGDKKSAPGAGDESNDSASKEVVVAMLPKLVNIPYFNACEKGARRAAAEIGVKLIYDGPPQASGTEQTKFIETWIRQRVDAICVAPNQPKSIRRVFDKARAVGIQVLTWDTDAPDSGRALMVNQVDDQLLGETLTDELARQMGGKGEWAIVIGSLDAGNLNTWRRFSEARAKEKYPGLKLVDTIDTKENQNLARERTETLLNARPNLRGIIAYDSNSVPGAAEALKRTGRVGKVALVGNSTPSQMRPYIKEGVLECFYLWDPGALGALTVRLAKRLVKGEKIAPGEHVPGHGPLVYSAKDDKMVILSKPIRFTKANIDEYDF